MTALVIDNVQQALDLLREAKSPNFEADLTSITFGDDFRITFRLPRGYHSEIPSQFLDAFQKESQKLLRVAALIENGRADVRSLTKEQLERYKFTVTVSEGSSQLRDNAADLIQNILVEALKKMDGKQAMITILGLSVIVCTTWGFTSYLENRKQVRLEEVASTERRAAVEAITASDAQHAETYRMVIETMAQSGDVGARAASAADEIQSGRLRAAAQTNETEVGDVLITQEEARELRAGTRRTPTTARVVKEMRVIDVNTADSVTTSIVLEDVATGDQWKVAYSDRMLGERLNPVVFEALRGRGTAMFTLRQKEVEDEIVSIEILDASPLEDDQG